VTLEEALATMLRVRGGGASVVAWLQRLPAVGWSPGRRRMFGAVVPEVVTLGKWRLSPTDGGLRCELLSGGIAVRSREESGMDAARLVADLIGQHRDNLTTAEREQVEVEIGALCEAVSAGRL
jgi:hypothetical protein